jgi:hypothetical protein
VRKVVDPHRPLPDEFAGLLIQHAIVESHPAHPVPPTTSPISGNSARTGSGNEGLAIR